MKITIERRSPEHPDYPLHCNSCGAPTGEALRMGKPGHVIDLCASCCDLVAAARPFFDVRTPADREWPRKVDCQP
jgi:hypothetical protein